MKVIVEVPAWPIRAVSELTVAQARELLEQNRIERARLDALDLELIARLEAALHDPVDPVCVFPERELMKHAGLSSRDAATAVVRAHVVAEVPVIGEMLAAGATTAGHVDALARGFKTAGADRDRFIELTPELVEAAGRLSVGEFSALVRDVARSVVSDGGLAAFERQRRSTYLKLWLDSDGMTQVRGAFDPVAGAALQGAIDREVERMFHSGDCPAAEAVMPWIEPNENRAARALEKLVGSDRHPDSMVPRAEVIVHVDLDSLTGVSGSAPVSRTVFGSEIPVETARRLACEAEIIPIVLDGRGVPLDVGRSRRLATAHQRRALESIYKTCAVPECTVAYHRCQIHHIRYWEDGGRTDLANMVPLCSRHHHAAHEGGWGLSMDPASRVVSFNPPDSR